MMAFGGIIRLRMWFANQVNNSRHIQFDLLQLINISFLLIEMFTKKRYCTNIWWDYSPAQMVCQGN